MKKIAVFASGSGSNFENLVNYFQANGDSEVKVSLLVCNNPQAGAIARAQRLRIPTVLITKRSFYESELLVRTLQIEGVDWIVLAGFLWLVPKNLIWAYPNKIINIHPSLLPNYGGKGMYGMRVHKAVIADQECLSGITIHLVNEHYDEGQILFQKTTSILPHDTPETLAERIHTLEYEYFPSVVNKVVSKG